MTGQLISDLLLRGSPVDRMLFHMGLILVVLGPLSQIVLPSLRRLKLRFFPLITTALGSGLMATTATFAQSGLAWLSVGLPLLGVTIWLLDPFFTHVELLSADAIEGVRSRKWLAIGAVLLALPYLFILQFELKLHVTIGLGVLLLAWVDGKGFTGLVSRWTFEDTVAAILLMSQTIFAVAMASPLIAQYQRLFPFFHAALGASLVHPNPLLFHLKALGFFTVVGITEELLCRWYLITRLDAWGWKKWSILLSTSTFFAVLHVEPAHMIATFLIGMIFGHFFYERRRVWPIIVVHALWDYALVVLTYLLMT